MVSHLTGCCPIQASAPGLQSLHNPALHVMQGKGSLTHAAPSALHTCGVVFMQRFASGWQMPVQLPAEHTFGHAPPALSCQWPLPSHVCGSSAWLGEQRLAPGVHSAQTAALLMHSGIAVGQVVFPIQLPLASQLCGTFPLHLT
jgi:hypothetical protein